jgi:hypothetical protein
VHGWIKFWNAWDLSSPLLPLIWQPLTKQCSPSLSESHLDSAPNLEAAVIRQQQTDMTSYSTWRVQLLMLGLTMTVYLFQRILL